MRHLLLLAVLLTATACTAPPPADPGPEPLPAHPSGTISKNELPAPARAN